MLMANLLKKNCTLLLAAALALLSTAGCGRRGFYSAAHTPAYPPECVLIPPASLMPDTLTVSLPECISFGNAPVATNESERILFCHLYQTLITIDCLGNVRPLIAGSWSGEDGGRAWRFNLRKGIRFWSGGELTGRDIIGGWDRTVKTEMRKIAGVDSVTASGKYSLTVHFDHPSEKVPAILSATHFSVTGPDCGKGIPDGTGSYIPLTDRNAGADSCLVEAKAHGPGPPVIRFIGRGARQGADEIGNEADIIVTSDPDMVEYAKSARNLSAVPLPWCRTYLLVSTTRIHSLMKGKSAQSLPAGMRDDLASFAVREEARPCSGRTWLYSFQKCERLSGISEYQHRYSPSYISSNDGENRILYDIDDRTAGELAGRIVALSTASGTGMREGLNRAVPGISAASLRTAGISVESLHESLYRGEDFAYIIRVPARPADRCTEAIKILERAKYLAGNGVLLEDALIPLVETRSYLISADRAAGAAIDWRGGIFITGKKGAKGRPR